MFSEKKDKPQGSAERNIIGSNTVIKGDVISEGDFRIEGKIEGSIKTSGRVIIGKTGLAKGKIECTNADIEGNFSGELFVDNLLTLKATAKISGDVVINKLSVEPGAEFNATCSMKSSVKSLKNDTAKKEKSAS
jgi:cytoskeletal protein CcmA (bactofilin family)